MLSDRESQREAMETQKVLGSASNRPPEVWVSDGEERRMRIRDAGPVALIFRYSVKVNGKWQRFTAPEPGEQDLFKDRGFRAALQAVYEVIDIDGYTNREGKKIKGEPRFFVANSKLHEQLEYIRRKKGGSLALFDIEIRRTGADKNTMYSAIPDSPSPVRPEWKAKPRLSKDFAKYYAPLTPKQQQAVLGNASYDDER